LGGEGEGGGIVEIGGVGGMESCTGDLAARLVPPPGTKRDVWQRLEGTFVAIGALNVYMYIYMICIYVHMYICIYVYMYICVNVHMYICIYVKIYHHCLVCVYVIVLCVCQL